MAGKGIIAGAGPSGIAKGGKATSMKKSGGKKMTYGK